MVPSAKVQKTSSGRTVKFQTPWSPSKPGPSAIILGSSSPVINSSPNDDDDDNEEDDSEPCCVCQQHSPPALQNYANLTIVNWAKCSTRTCAHWVHLQYCHPKTRVARNEKFFCPCCSNTQSEQ